MAPPSTLHNLDRALGYKLIPKIREAHEAEIPLYRISALLLGTFDILAPPETLRRWIKIIYAGEDLT